MKTGVESMEKTGKCSKGFVIPIKKCQERTAAACGVSRIVVHKILQEAKSMGEDGQNTHLHSRRYTCYWYH